MLKRYYGDFKPFLFALLVLFHTPKTFALLSLDITTYGPKLSNYLQSMTIANNNNLSTFRNSVVNNSSFNKNVFIDYPSPSNSIYTKMQFFYDARTTQNISYLNTLYQTLSEIKNKYFLDLSTQIPNVINWYSMVGSEIALFQNFQQLIAGCTTPSLLLSNIVQSNSYNRNYYQDYPSTTNSIYYRMASFFQERTAGLQTNINFLQNLLDLINAAMGKNFMTSTQNATASSWLTTVSNEKVKIDGLLVTFQSYLNQYQSDPLLLSKYILSDANYSQSYLQNYPSTSFSIYTALNALYLNRETKYVQNKNFLTNLQSALNTAKTKPFLTTAQQADVGNWLTTLGQEISLISNFNSTVFSTATTITTLTSLVQNASYNRIYFQNCPSLTSSIYTKIQGFFNQRIKTQTDLTNLKNLLLATQGKNFLTSAQNIDISIWLQTVNIDLSNVIISNVSTTTDLYNFTYIPVSGVIGCAFPNSGWRVSSAGNIILQFKANTTNNIYVHFYSSLVTNYVAWGQSGFYYHIKIDPTETNVYCFNGSSLQTTLTPNTSIKVTSGVTEDWWIALQNNNKIYVGKGSVAGQGQMGSWTIPSGSVLGVAPTYFGLGGATANTTYTNIRWSGASLAIPSSTDSQVSASTFVFDPAVYGTERVVFNGSSWVAPVGSEGNFAVKFRARGQKDIYIQLSPRAYEVPGNSFTLNIGGGSNTQTWVRNSAAGAGSVIIGDPISGSNIGITGGLPGDGSTWDNYWVRIINNVQLSFGKSTVVGTNEIARWTLKQSTTPPVQYVGFGGYLGIVQYADIQIAPISSSSIGTVDSLDPVTITKTNFASALSNANTIDSLTSLVNNSEYNKTYLQDYPSSTNSIYTKLKDQFDNRIENYIRDTYILKTLTIYLTNLKNLLDQTKTKDFITGTNLSNGQKKDIDSWSQVLATEINLLSSFDSKFAATSTIESLTSLVSDQIFNLALFINYPNTFNSIFTKIKEFINARLLVSNKNISFYTNLKNLLESATNKEFLSAAQKTELTGFISTVNREFTDLTTRKTTESIKAVQPQEQPKTTQFGSFRQQKYAHKTPQARQYIQSRGRSTQQEPSVAIR